MNNIFRFTLAVALINASCNITASRPAEEYASSSSPQSRDLSEIKRIWQTYTANDMACIDKELSQQLALINFAQKHSNAKPFLSDMESLDARIYNNRMMCLHPLSLEDITNITQMLDANRKRKNWRLKMHSNILSGKDDPETVKQLTEQAHENIVLKLKFKQTQKKYWQARSQSLEAENKKILRELQLGSIQSKL